MGGGVRPHGRRHEAWGALRDPVTPRPMPIFEAIRLALAQIRVQKLKSFFTLLGVTIGVMFLIAVVSIVEGMGRYVEDDFAGRMLSRCVAIPGSATTRRASSGWNGSVGRAST